MTVRKREELEAREVGDLSRVARKSASSLVYLLSILAATFLVVVLSASIRMCAEKTCRFDVSDQPWT